MPSRVRGGGCSAAAPPPSVNDLHLLLVFNWLEGWPPLPLMGGFFGSRSNGHTMIFVSLVSIKNPCCPHGSVQPLFCGSPRSLGSLGSIGAAIITGSGKHFRLGCYLRSSPSLLNIAASKPPSLRPRGPVMFRTNLAGQLLTG